jgi:peptide/nickel transport system ATP-binding protein
MSALILLNDVKVAYTGRKPILDIARLLLKPGQVTVVAGPSGSGKSTLGHALAGLLPFLGARVEGRIQVGERTLELHDKKAMRSLRGREIRWIPQEPGRAFTVTKLLLPQMLEGIERSAEINEQLARLLKALGLPKPSELEDRYPFEMSGGMLQRAAVISAFLPSPSLVVADEPTAHLDPPRTLLLARIITTLARSMEVAVLWITHDLRLAAAVADRVLFLSDGLVEAEGGPAELLRAEGEDRALLVEASTRLAMPQ